MQLHSDTLFRFEQSSLFLFNGVCLAKKKQISNSVFGLKRPVVDFTKSRKCEFQPIKSLEIKLTITLTINLRLKTFCEIDPRDQTNDL